MATPDGNKWHLQMVQSRYHAYNLSFEQAEAVYRFEQERDAHALSWKHFFSQWEEWDFEMATFREILKEEQLALYLSNHEVEVKAYEKELIEQDNSEMQVKQLTYTARMLAYYKDELIPGLQKKEEVRRYVSIACMGEKNKLNYLQEELKKYLPGVRKEILINHFRQYKTFRPNELKHALLRHSINDVWPDYEKFYQSMDAPTRAIADFLESKVTGYFRDIKKLLEQSIKDRQHFADSLYKEFYSNEGGWHVYRETTPEKELKTFCMSILLISTSVLYTHLNL
ncbi:hypothetical protein [Chitinophaga niabensis]|uniref:Uncharacterized protein n=1 Tax=Chitinophaga niabensis TaxID=536979 RepID=A0A1N6DCW2_9BACT|nr:hypothetical protein [Chitinophaga niabensis]SIN68629.1 hypothetical protein SAMN04488055_0622 [Chitinophaga niabensis]